MFIFVTLIALSLKFPFQMAIPTAASLGVAGVAAAGAWFFPFLVATIAYYHHASTDPERRPVNRENLFKEYDFIIIGMIILCSTYSDYPFHYFHSFNLG